MFKQLIGVIIYYIFPLAFNEVVPSEELPIEIVFQPHAEGVTPNCLLCEELVKMAEKRINKHTTKVSDFILFRDFYTAVHKQKF